MPVNRLQGTIACDNTHQAASVHAFPAFLAGPQNGEAERSLATGLPVSSWGSPPGTSVLPADDKTASMLQPGSLPLSWLAA